MKNCVLFLLLIIPFAAISQENNTIMTHVIKNKNIELRLDLPLVNYNFSRFDWSGKITSVRYKNIEISGLENLKAEDDNKIGKGFYNEFGLHEAIGYREIPEGDWFHKIGIGLLKKEGKDYVFSRQYEIRPAVFEVIPGQETITIRCQSESVNGYSYTLKKEIILIESGFIIQYELKNTGEKPINANEYVHNFLAINKALIGCDYILKFPFELKPEVFDGIVNPEEKVEISQHEIRFNATPKEQFYFGNLSGSKEVEASWELINTKQKIGIRETGDFKTKLVNLWGWGHVVSPELFFDICLKPGEEIKWCRTYTIFELN
jgi:hypothetical protein